MVESKVFNGNRLRLARQYRGMSISDLADKTMISKQAISQFENGKTSPGFETLLKLMNVLGFPREYFHQEDKQDVVVGNTYFRALLSTTKQEQLEQVSKTTVLAMIYNFLEKYIQFPTLNVNIDANEDCNIEDMALMLREKWGLGIKPISNIVHLMEKNGVIVTSVNTDSLKIDAFTQGQIINGKIYYFVILGDDKESASRRQFSAAHELGHILLHDVTSNTNEITKEEYKQMESEANEFAAAFLLPKESFLSDLLYPNKLDYYVELKKKWKVSISAMIIRAYRLDAINFNQYQYLMKQVSKRGWKVKEPLDDIIQVSRPTVLRKTIEILTTNQVLDEASIISELENHGLSLDRKEIEFLLGLDEGRLEKRINSGSIINLKTINR